jgi:CRP/FNR family cyclic AMP-dependent transcriptional regulator
MKWPLLEVLEETERRGLLAAARRRRFGKGEVIFHEGDPGETLHLVDKGQIGMRVHTPLGDVAMVRVLGPGEFFGELTVVSPGPRNATAVALTPAETLSVRREQFADLRSRFPEIERVLVEALVHEVRRLATQVVEATYVPAEKRVWRQLDALRTTFGGADEPSNTLPITQEVLAELAGCTRPTVNQVLRAGQDEGAIQLHRGRIDVVRPDLLSRHVR